MINPIYVAGIERSGTSLMYALLATHPNIAMTRRTNLWTHFYGQFGDLADDENLDRCLDQMFTYKRIVKLDPNPGRIRKEFQAGERTYGRLFDIIESHFAEQLGKPRWGDKSLHTERYAAEIVESFPGARIIHLMRDPRDRYASARSRWQVDRGGAGAAAAIWLSSFRLAVENCRRFPEHYRIVRYETLVSHPEDSLRDLCEFIGEPYTPVMFDMTGSGSYLEKGGNSSYGGNVAGKISTRSVGKYREVLSLRQVAFLQTAARREMEHLEYAPDERRLRFFQKLAAVLIDLPFESARMAAWYIREAYLDRVGRRVPAYRIVRGLKTTTAGG